MEEVDSIILHFLRQLNIDISDDIKSICDLSVETIIQAASKCLTTINHTLKLPANLPTSISHKIELAAHIASICKDLGYKNDVGYQTFLYYNEAELRQVFMFLIERLPNEGKQKSTNVFSLSDKTSLLMQNISNKIGEDLNSIWIPPCCNVGSKKNFGDFIQSKDSFAQSMAQTKLTEEELIQKIMKIKKNPKTQFSTEFSTEYFQKCTEKQVNEYGSNEDVKCETNKSLKELKELSIILRQKLDTLESERNVMDVEYSQIQKSCDRAEADILNVKSILNNIGITKVDPEYLTDNVLEKVQRDISILHKKSEDLTSRNLSLKVEIEKLKNKKILNESERCKCKKKIVNLKDTAKSIKEEYENKEQIKNQLKKNYDKLRVGNKRSVYTKRILEIISNVDKQNLEIQKILEDTRELQKEINTLEGQLDRCFSIADETLFRDAKKDDQAKKAYKLLALLHSECNTIVSLLNDTSIIARDIVDLEDNIKTEKSKRTEDTLKKIQLDLVVIQEEY